MILKVEMLKNELWYGGSVGDAMKGPFDCQSLYDVNMELAFNQAMPLYISTVGRYIWCEEPMLVHIEKGLISPSAVRFLLSSSLRAHNTIPIWYRPIYLYFFPM